jgi:hypothetical protein
MYLQRRGTHRGVKGASLCWRCRVNDQASGDTNLVVDNQAIKRASFVQPAKLLQSSAARACFDAALGEEGSDSSCRSLADTQHAVPVVISAVVELEHASEDAHEARDLADLVKLLRVQG